ncbi:hypothetical protein PspR84_21045 [Pseudomonas sp. R84]|jgi:hypothetical protein|uniref:NEL-type E3 ubiquitin ligase domain-containing protein n=1 Tax=Pseudomonas sp. R84 TaxID=1573712 RepID=UPI00131F7C04|nr:NEL-type E3 ubiquitin ligase domain-containing protein [Pseudomonas sp. R84]QHC97022.1 hypothetical protein PspR84_21045 [Pseudomonas sp. R84]
MSAEAKKEQLLQNTILSALLDATGDLDSAEALQKILPAHWLKATPATLSALDQTVRDLHSVQLVVQKDLDALKPLQAFCIDELSSALKSKWSLTFDVEKDLLSLPGVDCGCPATSTDKDGIQTIPHATQTLLQAAMQNFSEDEATDSFPEGSLVRISSAPAGVEGLTPVAFARFCRELDLGKRYQAHFQQVFGLRSSDDKVIATRSMTRDIAKMKRLLLQLDMHLAVLKNHLTPAGLQMLQTLIDADGVVSAKTLYYNKRPLIMQGIEILDSCVWGVVVFSARSVELYPDEWCLVYMAAEPERPLYEYSSFNAFKQYLTRQLKEKRYKDYFANSIDEDDKADFFKTFAETAELGHIKQLPISVPLFEFMVQSHVGKLQLDARKLAVPTEDIDEDVRQKRLLDMLQLGVSVVSVAGLVVPVLGQLMMGVAVGQLLGEVYEGVEDWRRGDHQQALSHLLSVVENIALMAAFAGGQKVLGTLGRKLVKSHPDFFGQFTTILNRSGKPRLWKPDMVSYEHQLPWGVTMADNSEEFYQVGAKTLGRVDHRIFAVTYDSASEGWRLEHPQRPQAYAPPLERHVEGGWRLATDHAEQWNSAAYTLKRIDPNLSEFSDTDLDMIRRLSGTSHEQLLRIFNDNLPLPGRLRDAVERVRIERQLRQLIRELEHGEIHSGQPVEAQLQGLPKLPGWPNDRYLEVTDAEGEIKATYPLTPVHDDSACVLVTDDQLASGRLLQTVIDGLYRSEVEALLGEKVASSAEAQQLAKTLGAALKADRRAVFERLYEDYDQSDADHLRPLRSEFSEVPSREAQALIDRASSVERVHLHSAGRMHLGLAQRVRAANSEVRLDRALTGFDLPEIANADTEKLAIQLLPHLSGWDAELRLVLRDRTLKGPILESIGPEAATSLKTCTLVKSAAGYEALGGDGKSLGKIAAGPDALYGALLKALPPRQRMAMGFPDPVAADSARLRRVLLNSGLDGREPGKRILISGKAEPLDYEHACLQADPSSTTNHPRALLRKVRRLYPSLTETQAIQLIDTFGDDPLSRAVRVKALRQDLKKLRATLKTWSEDNAAMTAAGGDLRELRHSRKAVAEMIEDSFRRLFWAKDESGQSVCVLNLDGMRVARLPTLPPGLSFDHIQQLSLKNMAQDDDVAYFLKAFKQIESLELDENKLTRLPEMLSHMPGLTRLNLANNQIRLTEQTLAKLSQLRTLQHLNLNDNLLGATPDVSRMFDLRRLLLRETGLTEMPKGLERLPSLDWVDLRSNQIKDLPGWLFKTPRRFSQALNLRANPLSETSKAFLETYRGNVGVGMGYLENDIARLDEQQARLLWFNDGVGHDWPRRNRVWTAFKEDSRAEGLFHLLSELGSTADSQRVRSEMQRRVWAVLEAAEADAPLCDQVLSLAANPINCTDSAAMNFSYLEVAVEVDRVTSLAGGRITTAKPLLKLGRGLFRLDQLDRIAQEHAARVPTADPLEVNLAYRVGLADTLDLPGQPRNMRFAMLAGVTAEDLELATNKVKTAELSSEWLKFLRRQPFWSDYLKRTFGRQFAGIDGTFSPKLDAVFEQADALSSADYLSTMEAVRLERETAENALLTRLTDDAIRLENLGICAMSLD